MKSTASEPGLTGSRDLLFWNILFHAILIDSDILVNHFFHEIVIIDCFSDRAAATWV